MIRPMQLGTGLAMLCMVLAMPLSAQNGSNYHALANGMDVIMLGVGAGGSQTASDGLGTYIPGEDLRGPSRAQHGSFAYKQVDFRESICIPTASSSGTMAMHYPLIAWFELAGVSTGHSPVVFPNPQDATCSVFPLGNSAGFVPFGTPAGSTASFVLTQIPSASGIPSNLWILLPNENLVPSSAGGTATLLGAAASGPIPINSTGFCWSTQFTWVPSATPSLKDANNGWWHWVNNNPLGNQYWAMSNNELNLWKSHTVASDAGCTAITAFSACVEYAFTMRSVHPNTNLATLPNNTGSAYGTQTVNITDCNGNPALNPNGGFDLGGHGTLSLSGLAGVPDCNSGLGAQNPAGTGLPVIPTLGFWTYDSTSGPGPVVTGSKRLTWLTVDFDHILGLDPRQSGEVTVLGDSVRVPSPVPTTFPVWPQTTTTSLFSLFCHEARLCPGCPGDPLGTVGFGVAPNQGGSIQLQLAPMAVCASLGGAPMAITYGTSGLEGPVGVGSPPQRIVWDPDVAATGGHKTFFLFE